MAKPSRVPDGIQKSVRRKRAVLELAEVVCFGMLIPSVVMLVDEFPAHNTGALVTHVQEIIEDDAAIIACLLRGWKVSSAMIGTALGNDARGKQTARKLKRLGVLGKVRLTNAYATPYEVDVSDRSGHRTYFWQREPKVLNTLDSADLALLRDARFLYVDWYDGDHILRAMDEAARLSVPVFMNLEYGHQDPRLLREYVSRARIIQASTDAAQREGDPFAVARVLLDAGAEIVLVTLAGDGCVAATRTELLRVHAPEVKVVDGCGAGASFSAGFMYGQLRGWDFADSVQFAIAAGSLKCTRIGLDALPLQEIKRMAKQVKVESKPW
ncbi:MAG TPA: carbohydrate kinase family protein [Anaerolineae bacterium]